VAVYFVDAIPLTAVGKVFKPALRWDATRRAVTRMLADLRSSAVGIEVEVAAHASHGSLIAVRVAGVREEERASMAGRIDERLNPLETRHEIVWA
jgi:fatty-acyl-CoA synthase